MKERLPSASTIPAFWKLLLFSAAIMQGPVWATSVDELHAEGHLEISSELLPADNIVPGQHVELVIKIATDRWFTGGTRLEIPEVSGLVILQTNKFASNSSENRRGQSWVVQRWSLDVFPQRAGLFTIPPLTAVVKVNAEDSASSVEGPMQSPTLHFQAVIPESLESAKHWVAAPTFKVTQSFDRELANLRPGDAFEREIVFEASDVMAMMLPSFKEEKIVGLTSYPAPPSLSNNSNRGSTTAKRVQRISYIAETFGQYQLPAQDFTWWDTRTGELEIRFLPAVDINVIEGSIDTVDSPKGTPTFINKAKLIQGIKILILVVTIVYGCCLFYSRVLNSQATRSRLGRLLTAIKHALHQLNQMRKPALPLTLNPGNSAEQ